MTSRARKPSSSSSEDSSSDDCPSPPKKNILLVKKPITPSGVVFSSEDSNEDVKPEIKKSAVLSQASGQAVDQDPKLAKLRQKLLLVARSFTEPFKPNELEEKYGKPIPFEKYGFPDLRNFLFNHPGLSLRKDKKFHLRIELDDLRQRVLTVARLFVPPFSFLNLLNGYKRKYRERYPTNICKRITDLIAGIPEIETIDAEKELFRVIGWDPRHLRKGAEYEAFQDEIYKLALRLESPFASENVAGAYLSTKPGSRIPFDKYGFYCLSAFMEEHPRFGKLDNGEEKCFFLKKSEPTVPPQNSRKRVLEGSEEKTPVAVKKKRKDEIKKESSSGGSSSDESIVEVHKSVKKISRGSRLDAEKQVKGLAKGKKAESSTDDSSESDEESLPLKKTTPASRLAGKKQAKGQKALAKGKESLTNSSDSDSPPVSKKAETTVKVKKEEPSADSSGFPVKSEASSLNGSASNLPNLAPQVGWNDNYALPQGGFYPPQLNQFNPMAYPPQMMSYQMQSMPVPPTKNELFGQLVTSFLNAADREGMDSNELTQALMTTITQFNKKKS